MRCTVEPATPPPSSDAAPSKGERSAAEGVPLVVDLDGTLIRSDTLWEAIFVMLAKRPWLLPMALLWLLKGRAHLKRQVATRAVLDPQWLPYHEPMLDAVRRARDAGRPVVLATATDRMLAEPVHRHLGLFDHLIASEGERNLRSKQKVAAIRELLGEGPFDYAGDSDADVALVAAARKTILVNPTKRLRKAAEAAGKVETVFDDRPGVWRGLLRLLRPQQWTKNGLILLPLLLSHELGDAARWAAVVAAIVSFSLAASAVYVLNDLMDVESDRQHPRKRRRPLAAATVRTPQAIAAGAACFAASLLLAGLGVSLAFLGVVVGYLVFTTAYTSLLKGKLFLDVLTLAWLYVYRVLAGGVAVGVVISPWLAAFSLFGFLSLALLKRFCELREASRSGSINKRRGYFAEDLGMLQTAGLASAYVAVLVFALYVNSDAVRPLYPQPELLWAVCPLLVYIFSRMWFLANRGLVQDDPLLFLIGDRPSLLSAVLAGGVVALAAWPL